MISRVALFAGGSAPVGVRQLTANVGYSDGPKTITFQQCSDHRVLIYIYNRLITLLTKASVKLTISVCQTKVTAEVLA